MIWRIFPLLKLARLELIFGVALGALAVVLELLQPWPLKCLVDYVLNNHPLPARLASVAPLLASENRGKVLVVLCAAIVFLAAGYKAAQVLSNLLFIRGGEKLVFELRCRAFDQLHRLSLAYHDRAKVGESLYRVAYDAHGAQSLISGALAPVLTGALLFAGILIVMLRLDVAMTLITLATAPLFLLLIKRFSRRMDRNAKAYHERESALVSAAQESIASIRAVQAFTMESQSGVRFRRQAADCLRDHLRLISSQLQFSGWIGVVMAVGTAAVAYFGATRVLHGSLSIGDILVFLAYLAMLYQPVDAFCQSSSVVQSAGAQLRRVFEVIDSVPAVRDRPNAGALQRVVGNVEFRRVSFGYEPDQPALRDFHLNIPAGSVVALVGRSGAGKTTVASLLTRFYDPASGEILLDGVDLRDLKLDWLRRQIGVVMQDPILFSGSIAENIAVGRPGASLAELERAAQRAQLHDDILQLPAGYQTLLGERGVNLSGGQRQRLSIARALLKEAPILILDEPTSALDSQTEAGLLIALKELIRDRTTLIIAHRLSTVRMADLIVVLDHGRIVEQGTHQELAAAAGVYSSMLAGAARKENLSPFTLTNAL